MLIGHIYRLASKHKGKCAIDLTRIYLLLVLTLISHYSASS